MNLFDGQQRCQTDVLVRECRRGKKHGCGLSSFPQEAMMLPRLQHHAPYYPIAASSEGSSLTHAAQNMVAGVTGQNLPPVTLCTGRQLHTGMQHGNRCQVGDML